MSPLFRINFPFRAQGGGWGRRYLKHRNTLTWNWLFNPILQPYVPLHIFDFSDPDDAADAKRVHVRDYDGWRVSDDGVIGGFSTSKAKFIPKQQQGQGRQKIQQQSIQGTNTAFPLNQISSSSSNSSTTTTTSSSSSSTSKNENQDSTKNGTMTETNKDDNILDDTTSSIDEDDGYTDLDTPISYLHWTGTIDTTPGLESEFERSGFVTLRSPKLPLGGLNVREAYDALEIICRSDGRVYTVNIEINSLIPNDMFKGYIVSTSPQQSALSNNYNNSNDNATISTDGKPVPRLISSSSSSSSLSTSPDDLLFSHKSRKKQSKKKDDTQQTSTTSSQNDSTTANNNSSRNNELSDATSQNNNQEQQQQQIRKKATSERRNVNDEYNEQDDGDSDHTTGPDDDDDPNNNWDSENDDDGDDDDDPTKVAAAAVAAGFDILYLPFNEFSSGLRSLEGRNIIIESIGFTLADGKNGPFQFDVARIRAVNFWDGKVHEKRRGADPDPLFHAKPMLRR